MDDSSTEYDTDTTDTETVEEDEIIYLDNEEDEVADIEEQLYREETSEQLNGKYFIGCYKHQPQENNLLFVNRIYPSTFIKFSGKTISKYFFWYSSIPVPKYPSVEILQLQVLPDDTYVAVVKTYYIKIIQRAWKKVYKQRQEYIYERMRLETIRNYEIGKRTCPHSFPELDGLLINNY